MCAPFHSAGSSDYTMQPVLLQLIMCNLQNFLPSVHLLYSPMPNLITYISMINFLVCFLVLCRIQWPCDIPCCFHQSCSQQHLAAAAYILGSSLTMWIIKQHWSKPLYLDQYYSDLIVSFVRKDSVCRKSGISMFW